MPQTRKSRDQGRAALANEQRSMMAEIPETAPEDALRVAALRWAQMWTPSADEQQEHVANCMAILRPGPEEARLR